MRSTIHSHSKPGVDMMPTMSSLVVSETTIHIVVSSGIECCRHDSRPWQQSWLWNRELSWYSDDKVGIMTTLKSRLIEIPKVGQRGWRGLRQISRIAITVTSYWARWRLKSPASRLFAQLFIQAQIKENIEAPRHWPLCGNSPVTCEFPAQMTSNAENVSVWWRYHDRPLTAHSETLIAAQRTTLPLNAALP